MFAGDFQAAYKLNSGAFQGFDLCLPFICVRQQVSFAKRGTRFLPFVIVLCLSGLVSPSFVVLVTRQ